MPGATFALLTRGIAIAAAGVLAVTSTVAPPTPDAPVPRTSAAAVTISPLAVMSTPVTPAAATTSPVTAFDSPLWIVPSLGAPLPEPPDPVVLPTPTGIGSAIKNVYVAVEPWVQYGFELATYAVGWVPWVGWLSPQIMIFYHFGERIVRSITFNVVDWLAGSQSFGEGLGNVLEDTWDAVVQLGIDQWNFWLPSVPRPPLPGADEATVVSPADPLTDPTLGPPSAQTAIAADAESVDVSDLAEQRAVAVDDLTPPVALDVSAPPPVDVPAAEPADDLAEPVETTPAGAIADMQIPDVPRLRRIARPTAPSTTDPGKDSAPAKSQRHAVARVVRSATKALERAADTVTRRDGATRRSGAHADGADAGDTDTKAERHRRDSDEGADDRSDRKRDDGPSTTGCRPTGPLRRRDVAPDEPVELRGCGRRVLDALGGTRLVTRRHIRRNRAILLNLKTPFRQDGLYCVFRSRVVADHHTRYFGRRT